MRRSATVPLLAALLCVGLAARGHAAVPRALISDTGGLRTVGLDGRDPHVLGTDAVQMAWSPDASRFAYERHDFAADRHELRVVDSDGTGDRLMVAAPQVGQPAWRPDGIWLAWVQTGPDAASEIWMQDLGTGRRLLLHRMAAGKHAAQLAWSPDGTRLAFSRGDAFSGNPAFELLLLDVRDGAVRTLVSDATRSSVAPDWHPTGDRLLFVTFDTQAQDGQMTIEVIRPDGTARAALFTGGVSFAQALWSPDGATVAFTYRYELHLMSAGGHDVRRITPRPETGDSSFMTDHLADWSPDGNYLGFTRSRCCRPGGSNPSTAYTVRVDGSELRRIGTEDGSWFSSFAPAVPVSDPPLVRRVSGSGREATAAALARETLSSADAVVLARSDDYADALAGGPLAVAEDAALLLTGRSSLHPAALAEVRRLTPATAYLLGGEGALSAQVEADLRAAGVGQVVRIAGRDRFDTARLVAQRIGGDAAYVVKGIDADPSRGWPDAVAAGGLAALQGRPILLAQGDALPEATAAALRTRFSATIVGGPAAVSAEVERRIQELGVATDRIAGRNRYETAIAVAERAVGVGAQHDRTFVASGAAFPDALAAGPAAARAGGVLLLAAPGKLTDAPATAFWFGDRAGTFAPADIALVGGRAALSDAVALDLDRWAQ